MSKQDGGASTEKKAKAIPQVARKPVSEKVSESIHLIRQLVDYGIPEGHYHLAELRELFNKWIRDPEFTFAGKLDFEAFSKKVEVMLPRVPGKAATLHLRAV
jgi:hypothetical protein